MTRFTHLPRYLTAALALGLLAGCLTPGERLEKRIHSKAAFFAALSSEDQQRLRAGGLRAGDTRDAAWIVYGPPDRVMERITASSTNEVWSYTDERIADFDYGHPTARPVLTRKGTTFWLFDDYDAPRARYEFYEYRRIEFEGDRIRSIETLRP